MSVESEIRRLQERQRQEIERTRATVEAGDKDSADYWRSKFALEGMDDKAIARSTQIALQARGVEKEIEALGEDASEEDVEKLRGKLSGITGEQWGAGTSALRGEFISTLSGALEGKAKIATTKKQEGLVAAAEEKQAAMRETGLAAIGSTLDKSRAALQEGGQKAAGEFTLAEGAIKQEYTDAEGKLAGIIDEAGAEAKGRLSPYAEAGSKALEQYQNALGLGPQGGAGVSEALASSPGYQFRLDQGLKGVQNVAAATGRSLSGRGLMELQTRGEGLAAEEYGRYVGNLANLTAAGQQAATTLSSLDMAIAAGKGDAVKFGASGRAGASQWAAGGRAATEMTTAGAIADVYGQQAGIQAGFYGNEAAVAASMAGSTMSQAFAMFQQGNNQAFQERMASWQANQERMMSELIAPDADQALLNTALQVGGSLLGAYLGRPKPAGPQPAGG